MDDEELEQDAQAVLEQLDEDIGDHNLEKAVHLFTRDMVRGARLVNESSGGISEDDLDYEIAEGAADALAAYDMMTISDDT